MALAQPGPQGAASTPLRAVRGNPSVISADVSISGKLVAAGDVQVDGRVEGDIRAGGVTVGEGALVHGDIYAEEAIIRGKVEGSIRARRVQLTGTAHVGGNIVHGRQLSVDTGAYFEGNVRTSDDPVNDTKDARTAAQ